MQRFISQENIKRFKEELRHPADEQQRITLERLLESEERRLAELEGMPGFPPAARQEILFRRSEGRRSEVDRECPQWVESGHSEQQE